VRLAEGLSTEPAQAALAPDAYIQK
jgi:hypothetical protein